MTHVTHFPRANCQSVASVTVHLSRRLPFWNGRHLNPRRRVVDKTKKMEEGAAPAEGAPPPEAAADDKKIVHTYPLVKTCDMPEEMWSEVMELVVTGCEKYAYNYELASKLIKQGLDQRFGAPWNIVVGEAYGYELTYLVGSLMFMYTGGNIACICWKAPQI